MHFPRKSISTVSGFGKPKENNRLPLTDSEAISRLQIYFSSPDFLNQDAAEIRLEGKCTDQDQSQNFAPTGRGYKLTESQNTK